MLVFDATPLIYLAAVDRLALLEGLDEDCVLPEAVFAEVVTVGIEAGHQDARRIEQAVERGTLRVVAADVTELGSRLDRNQNLTDADAAVLVVADLSGATAVIDERYGRSVAATEGIETVGTVGLVVRAVRAGTLTVGEARDIVDGMIDAGWYCSTDLYAKILRTLDSLAG